MTTHDANPWTDSEVQAWPDHELTIAYDISLKVSNDRHEHNNELKRTASTNADVCAGEMRRRGIFDTHRAR